MDNQVESAGCISLDDEVAQIREWLARSETENRPVQIIGTPHGIIAIWSQHMVTSNAPIVSVPNLSIAEIVTAMIAHLATASESGTTFAAQTTLVRRLGCSHADLTGWQRGRSYPARTFYPQLLKIAVETQLDGAIIARLEQLTAEIMASPPPETGPIWK